jgi:hypothetical protein
METEQFFAFLGEYVVIFQWIESQLDQIILTAGGNQNWEKTQYRIAKMTNEEKTDEAAAILLAPEVLSHMQLLPGWEDKVREIVAELGEERRRRNKFVHSQYLFEFMELGMPPLRSHRSRTAGEIHFDREYLGAGEVDAILGKMASLAFKISQAKIQLIHSLK